MDQRNSLFEVRVRRAWGSGVGDSCESWRGDGGRADRSGERYVTLFQEGREIFSVIHRGVIAAFVTSFPEADAATGCPSHAELSAVQIDPLESLFPPATAGGSSTPSTARARPGASSYDATVFDPFLCVFHSNEAILGRHLHVGQPQQEPLVDSPSYVCSAYRLPALTSTRITLPHLCPMHIVPGLRGIFLRVHRSLAPQLSESEESMRTMRQLSVSFAGQRCLPAIDTIWMASPLTVHPVYVAESQHPDSVNSLPRCEFTELNAIVIHQWRPPAKWDSGTLVAALCLATRKLRLADTVIDPALDVLIWDWWPHDVALPDLAIPPALSSCAGHHVGDPTAASVTEPFLTATVCSHGALLGEQLLFVHNALAGTIYVIRAPCQRTPGMALNVCFTISTPLPAVVLPCFTATMPQPIVVLHFPSEGDVTLYSGASLLQQPSPSNWLATASTMDVAPMLRTCGQPCRILSVAYHRDSMIAVHVSCSHNSTHCRTCPGEVSECEGLRVVELHFPYVRSHDAPLLGFVADTLEAVLGSDVLVLQSELIRREWEHLKLPRRQTRWATCADLLLQAFAASTSFPCDCRGWNLMSVASQPSTDSSAETGLMERFPGGFIDPLMLTALLVEELPSPSLQPPTPLAVPIQWTREQCGACLLALHLLYESCKIQQRLWCGLQPLGHLLAQLCHVAGWATYVQYYSSELGVAVEELSRGEVAPHEPVVLTMEAVSRHFVIHSCDDGTVEALRREPPEIHSALHGALTGLAPRFCVWPHLQRLPPHHPLIVANKVCSVYADAFAPFSRGNPGCGAAATWWHAVIRSLLRHDLSPWFVEKELCLGVAQPILLAISYGRENPDDTWPEEMYAVVERHDRVRVANRISFTTAEDVARLAAKRSIGTMYTTSLNDDDGVILGPSFAKNWNDTRVEVVQAMLNTAIPVALPSTGDTSEEVHKVLAVLTRRTLALPISRGMFTLCTQNVRVRDSIPLPPLNVDGRTADGISISRDPASVTAEHLLWPLFHNGCAAGLRFLPYESALHGTKSPITRHWVVYQTRHVPCVPSRAGLLYAAGLLGHLSGLQLTDIYSLLVSPQSQLFGRETTTIAVMLGLSCSFRGTSNDVVFRCLSMHVQSLTPISEDIAVTLDVQTAALVSIGLLCQQAPNSLLVELFLGEMSRLPSDEYCMNREGNALGAGFSLGLLLLGMGSQHGVPRIERRLIDFFEGARRESIPTMSDATADTELFTQEFSTFLGRAVTAQRGKVPFSQNCSRVFEGECYNAHVSGPAAVVALGFMYLRTGDKAIAQKLAPPQTIVGIQCVPPDMCLLRVTMAALVLWDSVEPTKGWLQRQVPQCLLRLQQPAEQRAYAPAQLRYLLMGLGYCISGAALALGIRYAGSMDADAKSVILAELRAVLGGHIGTTSIPIYPIQRSTGAFDSCISSLAIALSLVMAGTGDTQCFAIVRKLMKRQNATFGSHMAASMAMGLLFLGGGRLTLSSSLSATAALVMAFFPVWPKSTSDNSMHLQALRHLYCLAAVPRMLITLDIRSNQAVSVPVRLVLLRGHVKHELKRIRTTDMWTPMPTGREELAVRMVTPCLLPDASTIERLEIRSTQHYPLTIHNVGALGDMGVVVRVQERDLFDPTDHAKGPLRPSEALAIYWLRRLCSGSLSNIDSLIVVANFKALFAFVRRFGTAAADSVSSVLTTGMSLDRIMSIWCTLDRRFASLFAAGTSTAVGSVHPLALVVRQLVPVVDLANHLHRATGQWGGIDGGTSDAVGSAGSPPHQVDRTAMGLATAHQRGGHTSSRIGDVVDQRGTKAGLITWMFQALEFYNLRNAWCIREVLDKASAKLQNPQRRRLAVFQVQEALPFLEPETIERLVNCCVAVEASRS